MKSCRQKNNQTKILIILSIILSFLFLILFFYPSKNIAADSCRQPFIKPLEGEIIVGFRDEYYDAKKAVKRKHTGIDISGSPGDPVWAAANGYITYCGFSPIGGLTLVIKHNEKIRTTYLNLKSVFVCPGDFVSQGEKIASIGSADDPSSDLPHLHFGIIYNGFYLDPEDVLNIDYRSISKFLVLKYSENDYIIN